MGFNKAGILLQPDLIQAKSTVLHGSYNTWTQITCRHYHKRPLNSERIELIVLQLIGSIGRVPIEIAKIKKMKKKKI